MRIKTAQLGLLAILALGCGDDGGSAEDPDAAPTGTELSYTISPDPASGNGIFIREPLTISFNQAMVPDSLQLSGDLAASDVTPVWSASSADSDTLVLTPGDYWHTAIPGELVISLDVQRAIGPGNRTVDGQLHTKLKFSSGQAAANVIGQSDFVTSDAHGGGAIGDSGFADPSGNGVWDGQNLYLPDYSENRILGFAGVPTTDGASASFVLGQVDFMGDTASSAGNGLDSPIALHRAGDRFLVSDAGNNRVLIFSPIPTANTAASVVVGQADFGQSASACTQGGFTDPEGVVIAGDKLIVSDYNNHRVLIWNTIPTTNGALADVVLGQADFTTCTTQPVSATSFHQPSGSWTDGQRLAILDQDNNRVLIWNQIPTDADREPDLVLGQADFVSETPNDDNQDDSEDASPSARTLNGPYGGITATGGQFFVADSSNNRVLVWNSFPTTSFQPADVVLGQPDFVSSDFAVTATSMRFPDGLIVAGDSLIVADASNERHLIFKSE